VGSGYRGCLWSVPALLVLALLLPDAGAATVDQVVARYRAKVEQRLLPRFRYAAARWPPEAAPLLVLKDALRLELWVRSGETAWKHIRDYRIKGLRGRLGPKLREGDRQVPEGLYRISRLNPDSAFHLSLKLDYPNEFDRRQALREGRRDLGGDIFIHGNRVSRGCLAVGDNAIEELFVLAALVGKEAVRVIIAPIDFRVFSSRGLAPPDHPWVERLYHRIAEQMRPFRDREASAGRPAAGASP